VAGISVVALAAILPVSPAMAARSNCTDQMGGKRPAVNTCTFTSRTAIIKWKTSAVDGQFDLTAIISECAGACSAPGEKVNSWTISQPPGSGTESLASAGDCVVVSIAGTHGKITVSSA